ncbi:hatching enzyme 1.2-like [Stomoxys calcitrans]|uniref:Metalloendopeptidase n=1 Tax=Stomoxys calcitrans TaxID=35570 RepID=A0A1I8PMJ3_STOCA|nr:hatching enzyme 1.2-like [Stomoxys calcitrans]
MNFLKLLPIIILKVNLYQSRPIDLSVTENTVDGLGSTNNNLISSHFEGLPVQVQELNNDAMESEAEKSSDHPNYFDLSIYGSALYRRPDEHTAQLLQSYEADTSPVNPEELGPYVEGDLIIPQSSVILKNGLTSTTTRWPKGIVPYEIGGDFLRQELKVIANAINEYHRKTCIRFVPRTSETDYISIVNGPSGCWSSIGRVGGRQEVNLQTPGCLSKPGTAMHELMHVMGFLHEQNRQERDAFVHIQYRNIKQSAYDNFKKVSPTISFGVPYDYGSVMHYSSKAFTQNGEPTIVAKQPDGNEVMGQRDGFSALDIEKINRMYNCYDKPKADIPPPVDLTDIVAAAPSFRPERVIGDFLQNVFSRLKRVGK